MPAVSSSIPTGEIRIGESIACNGACLTVVSKDKDTFSVEISPETASRIDLGRYQAGRGINLERALQLGSRLGGHFVAGHVDSAGRVDYLKPVADSLELAVRFDAQFDPLVIDKGSIAIDGVSLTINRCRTGWLSVNLIPYTRGETNLNELKAGASVNLEFDLIGKYVVRMQQLGSRSGLTAQTLLESGW